MNRDKELLNDLCNRLTDDYNGNKPFKQQEEDRLVIGRLSDTIIWKDDYITIFCDIDKCLIVFVNDRGQSKVINFDDNFYSIEDNIVAYNELIQHTYLDCEEQQKYLGDFVKFCESEMNGEELNYEYLDHLGIKW